MDVLVKMQHVRDSTAGLKPTAIKRRELKVSTFYGEAFLPFRLKAQVTSRIQSYGVLNTYFLLFVSLSSTDNISVRHGAREHSKEICDGIEIQCRKHRNRKVRIFNTFLKVVPRWMRRLCVFSC